MNNLNDVETVTSYTGRCVECARARITILCVLLKPSVFGILVGLYYSTHVVETVLCWE